MSFKKQRAMLAVVGRPYVTRTLGVLLVVSATLWAGGLARAQQSIFDFDNTGPTSTADLGNFMSFFGHEPASWNVDPNPLMPANGNALHPRSNGTNVENFFTTVGIFNELIAEDVVFSSDISSPDNDILGLYVRYTGSSDVALENTYYFARLTTNGNTDTYRLHKVINGVEETLASGVGPAFAAGSDTAGETHNLQVAAKTVGNTVEITVSLDDQAITNMDPFVDATNPILGPGRVGIGQATEPAYFDNISFLNTGGGFVLGDFNGDGVIDTNDFNVLAGNFNTEDKSLAEGDINFDGRVNAADFLQFREIFNSQGQAGVAAVPEPGSCLLSLLGIGGLAMCLRRRRTT